MKNGLIIKSGNYKRTEMLERLTGVVEKLSSDEVRTKTTEDWGTRIEKRQLTSNEVVSLSNASSSIADALRVSFTNQSDMGVNVSNCQFTGLEQGMSIGKVEDEREEEEFTEKERFKDEE